MAAEKGALLVLASLISANLLDSVRIEEPIRSLVWSPVEELLAIGTGQSILVFRATQEGFEGRARELTSHTPDVHALAFSGDGTLLASRDARGLKIWDVESATLTAELHENIDTLSNGCPPAGIAFHPTKPWLAAVMPNGTAFRILDLSELV